MLSKNNSLFYTENYTRIQLNLTWESKIIIAHSGGIGGIIVPEIHTNKLYLEEYYEITFPLNNQESFSKLLKLSKIKNKYVFYLPKELKHLINKNITVHLIYNNYIPIKLSTNYQITLPVSLIDKFQLQDHDIYEIEIIFNNQIFNKIVLINRKDRSKEREKRQVSKEKFNDSYYISFPYENIQQGTEGKLKLIRKLESPMYQKVDEENTFYIPNVYYNNDNKYFIGKINENQIIVLAERSLSVQLPLYIHINDSMIYYFGNYLADGSLHGDSSAINASNHIQADYLIKVYNSFIYDSNLNFYLAFTKLATDLRTNQEIITELKRYWQSIHNVIIDDNKIRIWTSKYKSNTGTKITDCGSLEISDARSIVKILYNKLMEEITFLLLKSKSQALIWKFLLGYLFYSKMQIQSNYQ